MGMWEKALKLSVKIDVIVGLGVGWIFVTSNIVGCGAPDFESSSLTDFNYTGKIKLNFAKSGSNQIVVAAAPTATSLRFCEGIAKCQPSNGEYKDAVLLKSVSQAGKPQFFLVTLSTVLSNDLSVNFLASDGTGKLDHRVVKFQREAPNGGTPSAPGAVGSSVGTGTKTGTSSSTGVATSVVPSTQI